MACHDSDEEVIYKKEDHNDVENEDVWDDSALIKMYDEMVNKTYDSLDYQGTSTKKIKKAQGRKWNVNDHCLAPYYHDQLWYPAIIKRFGGKHSDKCEVLYDVYDELAWVNIEDLIQISECGENIPNFNNFGGEYPRNIKIPFAMQSSSRHHYNAIPSVIPPPPKVFSSMQMPNEEEALTSMLMSWYMTGYHTGYYQALQDQKKIEDSASQ